jgi:GTP cyclohydrolase I
MDKINIDNLFGTKTKDRKMDVTTLFEENKKDEKFDVNKLKDKRRYDKERAESEYKKILKIIQKKINDTNKYGAMYLVYEIPEIVFGCSEYKKNICMQYLEKKLKRDNFEIIIMSDIKIYVSWKKLVS